MALPASFSQISDVAERAGATGKKPSEIVEIGSGSGKSESPSRRSQASKHRSLADKVIARAGASQARRRRPKKKRKKETKEEGQEKRRRKQQDHELGGEFGIKTRVELGKLMPAVKRKAERKLGAVRHSYRNASGGRPRIAGKRYQGEVKMNFFKLFWSSKFEHRPRDQREFFLFSQCAGLLRDGHVNELADAIAGRIMALEVAASNMATSTKRSRGWTAGASPGRRPSSRLKVTFDW